MTSEITNQAMWLGDLEARNVLSCAETLFHRPDGGSIVSGLRPF